ncbi:MAG: PKD domain-containing protein [Acidobacteriota bacterium]
MQEVTDAVGLKREMDNYKKTFLFFAFLTIFFGGVAVQEANAAIWYVSTTGNDANSGSLSAPVATLRKAHELAAPGDTIYLRGGTYTQTRYLWLDKAGIAISSYPGENAIISASTTDEANLSYVLFLLADNQSLMNIEVRGGYYYAVKIESNLNCVLRNCKIGGSGRDCIKTFNADNLLIEKCEIGPSGVRDASNAEGIDSIGSLGVTIRENYIHDTATCGVYLKGGAKNGIVERNRVERAGHAGILLGQDTDLEFMRDNTPYECRDSICRNNVVISTNGAGIGTYSGSNVRFENNTLFDVAKVFHAGLYCVTNSRDISAENAKFRNNIVVVNSNRPMVFVINPGSGFGANSNIYYKPAGGTYRFSFESPARTFYWESFAEWQVGMNVDGRSVVVDPMLDHNNLCQPFAGSPAIDRGEVLDNPLDYRLQARPQGAAFDIGAHEKMASGGAANLPPTVAINATPTTGTTPLNVAFASTAADPEGQALTYAWDFGDGTTGATANPSHVYQSAGSFTARCTVRDPQGATASATVTITASAPANRPPTVSVIPSSTNGPAPLSVTFRTTAADPDGQVVAYSWDFGDGQTSNEASPTHVYQTVGTFTARVVVRDNLGAQAGTQVTITVTDEVFQEPVINMVTPDGGEVINGGSVYTIKWTATGTGLGRTDVAYSLDGGLTWIDIINSYEFITSLNWTVPNVKCKAVRIRVVVYGPRGTGQDMSAKNFTIVKVKAKKAARQN